MTLQLLTCSACGSRATWPGDTRAHAPACDRLGQPPDELAEPVVPLTAAEQKAQDRRMWREEWYAGYGSDGWPALGAAPECVNGKRWFDIY